MTECSWKGCEALATRIIVDRSEWMDERNRLVEERKERNDRILLGLLDHKFGYCTNHWHDNELSGHYNHSDYKTLRKDLSK